MRAFLLLTGLATAIGVIAFATLSPDGGLMFQSQGLTLALGVIGVGLCKRARDALRE